MTARGGAVLYTPGILALAVGLGKFPMDDALAQRGEASSRVCGSRILVGFSTDENDAIARAGARVSACAIGQAAAAVFLTSAPGCDRARIADALGQLEAWLAGNGIEPDWPGIVQLAAARDYPARHGAILLPWKAALLALSNPALAV